MGDMGAQMSRSVAWLEPSRRLGATRNTPFVSRRVDSKQGLP